MAAVEYHVMGTPPQPVQLQKGGSLRQGENAYPERTRDLVQIGRCDTVVREGLRGTHVHIYIYIFVSNSASCQGLQIWGLTKPMVGFDWLSTLAMMWNLSFWFVSFFFESFQNAEHFF